MKAKQQLSKPPERRHVPLSETREVVTSVFLAELLAKGRGTVELVHRLCTFEHGAGPLIGIAINSLARSGRIRRVDVQNAKRTEAHGRFLSVWERVQ